MLVQEDIRDLLLNPFEEEASPIEKIYLVDEPEGKGLAVQQADGHVYKYTVDTNHPKYSDINKLLKAAQTMAKFRQAGPVLGWLHRNAILYSGSKKK